MGNNKLCDGPVFGEKLSTVNYSERVAVYGVAINDGRVATVKTKVGYFLPGGGIEKDENHRECLKREFIEEIGYKIEIGRYIGNASLYHKTKTGEYKKGIGHFYIVNLTYDTKNKIEEDHDLIWLDINECCKNLFLEHQVWAVLEALK